jgi:hypothetical protein
MRQPRDGLRRRPTTHRRASLKCPPERQHQSSRIARARPARAVNTCHATRSRRGSRALTAALTRHAVLGSMSGHSSSSSWIYDGTAARSKNSIVGTRYERTVPLLISTGGAPTAGGVTYGRGHSAWSGRDTT